MHRSLEMISGVSPHTTYILINVGLEELIYYMIYKRVCILLKATDHCWIRRSWTIDYARQDDPDAGTKSAKTGDTKFIENMLLPVLVDSLRPRRRSK